jgi:prepilin-type processing-associated H-X9-DG protein
MRTNAANGTATTMAPRPATLGEMPERGCQIAILRKTLFAALAPVLCFLILFALVADAAAQAPATLSSDFSDASLDPAVWLIPSPAGSAVVQSGELRLVNGYWFAAIGPYLDEGRRFDQSKVKTGPWPQNIPFACPSCTNHGWGGAGIDVGINGYQVGATQNTNNITTALRIAKASALSTTLLVADAQDAGGVGAWQVGWRIGAVGSFNVSTEAIATRHKGRANVLYFDGHVGQVTAEQLKDPKFVEQLGGPKF